MYSVDVKEFRKNIFHYIELCSKRDINITRNGEVVAVLSNPDREYYKTLTKLCGCLGEDKGEDYEDIIGEEILKKYNCH